MDPEVAILLKQQQEDETNEGALRTAAELALNNARIEAEIDATIAAQELAQELARADKAPLHPADDPERQLKLLKSNTYGTPAEVIQYWNQYKIYYQYMTVD